MTFERSAPLELASTTFDISSGINLDDPLTLDVKVKRCVMKIGELSKRTGLLSSTLRYYESIGLFPAAKRENGQRIYDEGVLERLRFIRAAKATNFSLEEIARSFSDQEADWRPFAEAKVRELESVIEGYQEMWGMLMCSLKHSCVGE